MTRPWRIARNIGIGLAGFLVIIILAAIIVVQTDWFRNFVREKIIALTEEGTGGRVEVRAFSFDWRRMEVLVSDFVIHGKEPPGAAPFVRASRLQANLRLFTSPKIVDISFLGIEKPGVNVMVFPDGTTNVPQPKDKKPKTDKTALDTVVDLAVDYFRISDGVLALNDAKNKIDLQGSNLRAQLWFNIVTRSYKGEIGMQPMYVVRGRNTPVVFSVRLPVVLDRTRIGFDDAKITTPASDLTINGAIEDLNNPKMKVRVNGKLALTDLKNLGDLPLDLTARNVPSAVTVDANAEMADDRIVVNGLRVDAGASNIEASGVLKDPQGNGALQFRTSLALDEIGRLAKLEQRPGGVLLANGTAKLDAANNYQVTGEVEGRNLSFQQGAERIRNVQFHTALNLDPKRLDLQGLSLSALGGQFHGDASMEEFARYHVNGTLRNFDLRTMARAFGQKDLAYDGVASGPVQASGDLKAAGSKLTTATVRLSIAPGRRGIPVSGRLNAAYSGATNNVSIENSYIQLPHTRLNLNGSLNNRLNIDLASSDIKDLLAGANVDVALLSGGQARFSGALTGGASNPQVSGHLAMTRFAVEGRTFDALNADIAAAKNRATVSNALLERGPMQARVDAAVGLRNWSLTPNQPVQAKASVRNGDLADVMALAGQKPAGYAGALTMDASVGGTAGNPTGQADLAVVNGTIQDEPFDRLQARVNLSDQLVTIPSATLQAGPSRVDLSAEFQHPRDSFTTGKLHANVKTNQVQLASLRNLQKQRPNTAGVMNLNADVTGALQNKEFLLSSVNADVSARNLRFDGQPYGDLTAKARTTGQQVNYDVVSNFAGSDLKINGNTQLVRDYPTVASANMRNLPVERILAAARKTDIPARGNLSGSAQFRGTMKNPEGSVDLDLANAVLYDEPIDHVRARATWLAQRLDVPNLEIVSGPARLDLSARYDHAPNDLNSGDLTFRVNSNRVDLARIRNVQKARPGLGGVLQIAASGAAAVREKASPQVLVRDLNADIGATGISANGRNFGDLSFKANTAAGRVTYTLDSNLAGSTLKGQGTTQLAADYPTNAEFAFNNVTWSNLQPLVGSAATQPPAFDAVTDGRVTISGPVLRTDQLRGSLQIPRLQITALPRPGARERAVAISNQGPIVASLDRGVIRVDSARLVGPQTNISLVGSASTLQTRPLDLALNANTNLKLLESFSPDIYASGNIVVAATVRGTMAKPQTNGKIELQKASLNHVDLPNGISNASGVIVLNGNTATIRDLTGETGGGTVALAGFVAYENGLRLGVRSTAKNVRIRTQQGVSVVASARVNLTGTTQSSLASGAVTIDRVTYAPQSDFGSILTRAAPPVQAPEAPNPLLDNMRLDVRVRTSSATAVQASVAQNISVDADLRLRGTAARPSVLGRVQITQGDLVFFGSQYRVSQGIISFYNPVRIEPVLNITLETVAKGVNVVLTVTGPVDNMKLSYTSDPPLQFQEIVGLLASGKTPTSDPTLLANQPSQPPQSYTQMGETALVSKALADPLANRLERVFGVSQLKIDPTFTSGSDLPQARVTLQQQVAPNITFTYVSALQDPNAQIIRIEWAVNRQWSAVANRDENGIFSINFQYKKQFR